MCMCLFWAQFWLGRFDSKYYRWALKAVLEQRTDVSTELTLALPLAIPCKPMPGWAKLREGGWLFHKDFDTSEAL